MGVQYEFDAEGPRSVKHCVIHGKMDGNSLSQGGSLDRKMSLMHLVFMTSISCGSCSEV